MIDPQLEGKTALVTGANHGIGAAIATALAVQGVQVFITYQRIIQAGEVSADSPYIRNRSQDAAEVVQAIHAMGGTAEAAEFDLSDPESVPRLFDAVEGRLGGVDILVNNAAHWEPGTFIPQGEALVNQFSVSWMDNRVPTLSAALHDAAFAVNARGTALMMVEYARRFILRQAQWGRIINISTDSARSFPSEAVYGASKYAMESYSRAAAVELGQFGITVNIVSPGPTDTGWLSDEMKTVISQNIPLKRVGYPDDIADVVVFLASHQARWVTGQLINVGGGHRM